MLPHSTRLRGTTGDMLSQDATLTTSKLSKIKAGKLDQHTRPGHNLPA